MVRIVHTGDMHFDSPFASLPTSVASVRKEEQKKTFMRIIEAVRAYQADALLIAGDMFDSRFVSADTVLFLKNCFSEIQDTAVFVAPGNHDFLQADSPYLTENFGDNVYVFKGEMEAVPLKDAVIYGFGFPQRFLKESVLPPNLHSGDKAGILLLHGDIASESDYNPISVSSLSQSGLTYAALGHIHAYSGILRADDVSYAYCGIPEGRHFDESGTCGYIVGEISGKEANLSFVPVCCRQNITAEINVTGLETFESIRRKIEDVLEKDNLYKIVLTGEISGSFFLDTEALVKMLAEECFYLKIKDKTTLPNDSGSSLLESLFTEALSDKNDEIAKRALRLGLEAIRRQKR